MPKIKHVNIPDQDGNIYCCLRNRVVALNAEHLSRFCSGCKMFTGSSGGQGVECTWDDIRDVNQPHVVKDPYTEWTSNQSRQVKPMKPQMFNGSDGTMMMLNWIN